MRSRSFHMVAATLIAVAQLYAQNADSSGDNLLNGDYFVRQVLMTGTTAGNVTAATSVIGVVTFNGKGTYTFKGQSNSLASGANASVSLTGTYNVGSNGFLRMQGLADQTVFEFGGVGSVGPSAFVASATEGFDVDIMIGIPAGSNVSNASFTGSYTGGSLDFSGASITAVRQATFNLTSNGAGSLGTVSLSGAGADLGNTQLNQTAANVTYTLSGEGSGTINFGATATGQLVSGTKQFYLSSDGNIILGGSPTGFDFFVGIRSLTSPATNATATGGYYMAAFEDQVDPTGKSVNIIDAFYGSANATGTGTSLFHNRTQSLQFNVYDFTYSSQYSIAANGTIPSSTGTPYQFAFGANGQAFIATGNTAGSPPLYSLTLGLAMPKFSGSGVYLSPNGIVSTASFAPNTNPIAPGEIITLFGTGLATAIVSQPSYPLPTTLGGVKVTINGTPAPLIYVSPTQINALVPMAISPSNGVAYATFQVTNNSTASNSVTVYTSNSSPGVFANPNAVGAALAEHANYVPISASSPANPNETIILYVGGLGAVSPAVTPDGTPAPASPLSTVNDQDVHVDFSGALAASPLPFAGLTPLFAGLYQINVTVPSSAGSNVYVDIGTSDGYTSEATMSINSSGAAVVTATGSSKMAIMQRMARNSLRGDKKAGLQLRAR